ncbi:helix-turn-helix transcriptional regulator [uncultured Gimesia sp.]|uniref:helix-turn-helix domain-containing protein n=1 Tax=uncultured Gimesia sp. TaxID=1678688 RepID=UPI0030DACA4B|tara:strand:- start:38887 stop:40323 length:1437 start_codon:yes stop_codon:yes gene_type:complete
MIKNDRQYKITKTSVQKFVDALHELKQKEFVDPLLAKLEKAALESQHEELQLQIREYEELRDGKRALLPVATFADLPKALIQARIASGKSQKDLAELLGMKEQQIQRYESQDYTTASLARLIKIANALGLEIHNSLVVPVAIKTSKALFAKLDMVELDKSFTVRRLLPKSIAAQIQSSDDENVIRQAASFIGRAFGWADDAILGKGLLSLNTEAVGMARFKLPANASEKRISAYTVYAHYLALLTLQATKQLKPNPISIDPTKFRQEILDRYGSLDLESVLSYAWDLGVPVLPLNDPGRFHGACWRNDGRNVIVLKQRTKSQARWVNDLIHELFHAAQEPEEKERAIIESSEMSLERRESDEEIGATMFAGDVTLDCRAEELAQICVEEAGGSVERLKRVVSDVASQECVETGALANYLAFRLSLQDINWWGTATNLQINGEDPWATARDFLIDRLSLNELNEVDRELLTLSLTTLED